MAKRKSLLTNAANPSNMYTEVVMITAAMAAAWLKPEVNVGNRKMNALRTARYASDMRTGRWLLTHQGIAFDCKHRLIDGQHRLAALIKSECGAIAMLVCRNCTREAAAVMDIGGVRSAAVGAAYHDIHLTTAQVAIARSLYFGLKTSSIVSNPEIVEFLQAHASAIQFGVAAVRPKTANLSRAPIGAAFASAFYHAELPDLERAALLYMTGVPPDSSYQEGDRAMLALRTAVLSLSQSTGGSSAVRVELFGKAQRAIYGFLQREELAKIFKARSDYFPLPGSSDSLQAVST